MQILKTYDLMANFVTLAGVRLGGWGEDGGVEYAFESDNFEHISGADDSTVVSKINDGRLVATVTVLETSATYRHLAQLAIAQLATIGPVLPLAWGHVDLGNGDAINDGQAVMLNLPGPSKGRKVGTREFKILLPNGKNLIQLGLLNII